MDEGKATKSGETTQPGAEVDADLWSDFRATVGDVYGNIHGNVGTATEDALRLYIDEYGGDNSTPSTVSNTDLLTELREIKQAVSGDDLHTHTKHHAKTANLDPQVANNLANIIDNIPDSGEIFQSDVKKACRDAGVTDEYRSIPKYRELLEDRGVLLPHPTRYLERKNKGRAWEDGDKIYVRPKRFVAICETNSRFTGEIVDRLLHGPLEDRFSEADYRDALPEKDSFKIDELSSDGDHAEGSV